MANQELVELVTLSHERDDLLAGLQETCFGVDNRGFSDQQEPETFSSERNRLGQINLGFTDSEWDIPTGPRILCFSDFQCNQTKKFHRYRAVGECTALGKCEKGEVTFSKSVENLADLTCPLCIHTDYGLFNSECTTYLQGDLWLLDNIYFVRVLCEHLTEISRNFVARNFASFRRGFQSSALVLRVFSQDSLRITAVFRGLVGPSRAVLAEFVCETTYIIGRDWQLNGAVRNVPFHFRDELDNALAVHQLAETW
jgi:hypothetical protein